MRLTNPAKSTYYHNMDIVRYLLSLAVIVDHTNIVAGYDMPFFISSFEAVGGFFALSGFLMYPNYLRHDNCMGYLGQRARRILPPYIFIVVGAALFLVIASTLTPTEYFTSKGFYAYLAANLSFLNWLHPDLPGVFQGVEFNISAVNASLWTMKIEWCLYFSVPIFIFFLSRIKRLSTISLSVIIIIISILYRLYFSNLYIQTEKEIYHILSRQIFGQLSYFYFGMLIYFLKDIFSRNLLLMGIIGIALVYLSRILDYGSIILNPLGISMTVMAISMIPYSIPLLSSKNNISYEMYLFHFPIIQFGIFLGVHTYNIWIEYLYVLSVTIVLSLLAHFSLEKLIKRPR
ncbi:MAG: acyltransferase [Bacteroides sp.]|nr:acyltransferase [Bacteroides sp.]